MRHKYGTRGIVLARAPIGETSALLTIVTEEVGLVRARAQSLRRSGAKLSASLATYAESDMVLVRGAEQWRVSGALLIENWTKLLHAEARERAGKIVGLLLRLVPAESHEPELYALIRNFFKALHEMPERSQVIEILAALCILRMLGLDAGEFPDEKADFSVKYLDVVDAQREEFIARINHGISASGL